MIVLLTNYAFQKQQQQQPPQAPASSNNSDEEREYVALKYRVRDHNTFREAMLLHTLSHPNIVPLLGIAESVRRPNHVALILPFWETDLEYWLAKVGPCSFSIFAQFLTSRSRKMQRASPPSAIKSSTRSYAQCLICTSKALYIGEKAAASAGL